MKEKLIRKGKTMHVCFNDLKKTFDRVRKTGVWMGLEKKVVGKGMIETLKAMCNKTETK